MNIVRTRTAALCCACLLWAGATHAVTMPEGAIPTAEQTEPRGRMIFAVGAWSDAGLPQIAEEGQVSRNAWKLATDASTFDLAAQIKEGLKGDGFEVSFECQSDECGGFDFRFSLDAFGEPDMHVDLSDFRYVLARKSDGEGTSFRSVLVSRSSDTAFIQINRLDPAHAVQALDLSASSKSAEPTLPAAPPLQPKGLAEVLEADGRIALDDLDFATGAAQLSDGPFSSLAELAAYLIANPDRRVTLVGHTDASGSLDANVALSRKRAAAVADRLVSAYGVPRGQVTSDGVGYLVPRATNLTEEGRQKNRRVEAMLASTR